MRLRAIALLMLSLAACADATAPAWAAPDVPPPAGSYPSALAPWELELYAGFARDVTNCSSLPVPRVSYREMDSAEFHYPGIAYPIAGLYEGRAHRITIRRWSRTDGYIVRHEMLHAALFERFGDVSHNPRYFGERGMCGGVTVPD